MLCLQVNAAVHNVVVNIVCILDMCSNKYPVFLKYTRSISVAWV